MLFRNNQHMSWVDRANRQKGADHLVFIDDTRWSISCDYVAEDASFHALHLFLLCTNMLSLAFLRKLVRQILLAPHGNRPQREVGNRAPGAYAHDDKTRAKWVNVFKRRRNCFPTFGNFDTCSGKPVIRV